MFILVYVEGLLFTLFISRKTVLFFFLKKRTNNHSMEKFFDTPFLVVVSQLLFVSSP